MTSNVSFDIQLIFILLQSISVIRGAVVIQTNGSNQIFPETFMFGVSSAAYQIEGAWNVDGKEPSIWDEFTHSHPEKLFDGQNGDVAANSYEYYMDDVEAVKNLIVNFYRFSISWTRVLPSGDISNVNEKGIEYYNNLIDALIQINVQPIVTMYHFDLPRNLQLLGGFANSIITIQFLDYAQLLFERFGDRVKHWVTFNEPAEFCVRGYGIGDHAPGINAHGNGEYLCAHNVLKAHAMAYHLYRDRFFDRFNGKIGISLDSLFFYSESSDNRTVDRAIQFSLGWFANPIFGKDGNYPLVMVQQIANNSLHERRSRSRLPIFSENWIARIHGSADFFGLNYYTSRMVDVNGYETIGQNPSIQRDRMYLRKIKYEWRHGHSEWLYSVPNGLGDILRWIKTEYENPEVMVLENGWSDSGEINDYDRVEYFREHLQQILNVIHNDECNVRGYSVWSLIDNYEWLSGYNEKFGLYAVNMSSPKRERTPKLSAQFVKVVAATRQIPHP